MLPVMIYEPHEATRALILSALGAVVDGKIIVGTQRDDDHEGCQNEVDI